MPSFFSIALMAGPPPCTITTRTPSSVRVTRSFLTASLSWPLTIALPPYLMPRVLPWYFWIYGVASEKSCAISTFFIVFLPFCRSGAVVAVDLHIGVGQIAAPGLGRSVAAAQVNEDLDLGFGQDFGGLLLAVGVVGGFFAHKHLARRAAQPHRC